MAIKPLFANIPPIGITSFAVNFIAPVAKVPANGNAVPINIATNEIQNT